MNSATNPLDDRQFLALLSLLDDDDPEVASHVWGQLSAMGPEGMERLEAAWEIQEDPEMQARLEEVMHRLHLEALIHDLMDWRKAGGKNLLHGWFTVSRYQFPELDFPQFRNEVNRLVNKTWLELNERMTPDQKIRIINHILFRMEGYSANAAKPHNPNNNFINYLLEQQEGNVVSLSMLYLIIGQELNLPLFGVILPGYFVLLYKDDRYEFFIDVLNGGKTFSRARLETYLKDVNVEQKAAYFKPTSNIYIILNLLETLMADYDKAGKEEKAAEILEILKGIEIRFD